MTNFSGAERIRNIIDSQTIEKISHYSIAATQSNTVSSADVPAWAVGENLTNTDGSAWTGNVVDAQTVKRTRDVCVPTNDCNVFGSSAIGNVANVSWLSRV